MIDRASENDMVIEVFADITCPFTHVGLKRVLEHVEAMDQPASVWVRAWPLEWVNGAGLECGAVLEKAAILTEQLGVNDFEGLDPAQWPETTLPALELAAAAYDIDMATGLAVSMHLRTALFEQGQNIQDPGVLAQIAAAHGVQIGENARAGVQTDYDDGGRRGVAGSPHFMVGSDDFFCPALDLGHDPQGHLTARFDPAGLSAFFARIDG